MVPFAVPIALVGALLSPLERSPGFTSGFGEYRPGGRFHAGLDYSTEGRTGLPVRAVADGWVERVRASGVGYGRSVYLRLADGRTAVYGHLSAFAPALDAYVFARQDSSGQYEQDLWPPRGAFRFRRGEVLAFSGESGAGPPHLHFEIRRGDMNLHPLRQGIRHADRTPPSISAVTLAPAAPGARVAEAWRGAWGKRSVLAGPRMRGPFRILLDTWDRVGDRPNRLSTYRLLVRVDGALLYEAVLDSVSWDDMVISDRVFDLAAALDGVTDRRALQATPGDRTGIVRRGPTAWELSPGRHRLEFVAEDEAGNRTTRSLDVTAEAADVSAGVDGFARPPGLATGSPYAFTAGGAPRRVRLGAVIGAAPEDVVLSWQDGTFYEPSELVAERASMKSAGGAGGLVPTADAPLTITPQAIALGKPARLRWVGAPGAPGPVGLFRRNGVRWSLLAARDPSGAFEVSTRRLGAFALLADTTAPRIVPPPAYAPRAGEIPSAFVARIHDDGAGLVAADQVVRVNGRRVPAEYDPESDRLTWRPRAPLVPGAHVIEVEVVDALGNRASVRLPVAVR